MASTEITGMTDRGGGIVERKQMVLSQTSAQIQTILDNRFGKNHIAGLITSNNGVDADHDIDIVTGEARDADDSEDMVLASVLTKQIDAVWAVGTNAGGLDTGTVAEGLYAVWLIKRTDTNVVDVLISLSFTSPTMPASYTKKRLLGFVNIDSSANLYDFKHIGDYFWHEDATALDDVSDSTIVNEVFEAGTISCPPDCLAYLFFTVDNPTATGNIGLGMIRRTGSNAAASSGARFMRAEVGVAFDELAHMVWVMTDASRQIEYAAREVSGSVILSIRFHACKMLTRSNPV